MGALTRSTLRQQIKDLILGRIIDGQYRPGERLVESRLAQELGVSQSSIREALRDLEQLGCLVHAPNKGCSVRAFSTDELLEAYPVRAALEALAAETAAQRIDEPTLARLDELLEGMVKCADRAHIEEQARLNVEFHRTVVNAAGNATLTRQWALLEPGARTYLTSLTATTAVDLRLLAERHRPVLEALRRGDGPAAARAIREHLLEAAAFLAAGIERKHLDD